MLLTFEDMEFLSRVTSPDKNDMLIANNDLSQEDKERLLSIDEANFLSYEKHLITNYQEIK